MAECTVSHQVLKELYHDIYKLHWSYLELEEGLQKLDEQKALEGLLKKFLCVVPHNRKFFLPETFSTFKRTITQMKDFSVVKMLNGFESISQYANNLFTKPWRKEYRTIKMYSGFFIHEIKSNLIDPEEIFIAMGYKRVKHELVLDGEICPDQVMNVSRDAMTAYTECKILNRIYSELTTNYKVPCTWLDIFNYREQHTGGVTETIEAIRSLMQRNLGGGREKQEATSAYVLRPPQSHHEGSVGGVTPNGQQMCMTNCPSEYLAAADQMHPATCAQQAIGPGISTQGCYNTILPDYPLPTASYGPANPISTGVCGRHPHLTADPYSHPRPVSHHLDCQQLQSQNVYAPHGRTQMQPTIPPQSSFCDYAPHSMMPHSKSMDHYSYPTVLDDLQAPPRVSHTDSRYHAQYEPSNGVYGRSHGTTNGLMGNGVPGGCYDPMPPCAANAYNVSGTRYPLPYSLSTQFAPVAPAGSWSAGYYDVPHGGVHPVMGNGGESYQVPVDCVSHTSQRGPMQRNVMPSQPQYYSDLIKPAVEHKRHHHPQPPLGYEESSDEVDRHQMINPRGGRSKDQQQLTPRTSDFDSYEEMFGDQSRIKGGGLERERERQYQNALNSNSKPHRPDKVQDGVGSFESWDYVYQSLDQDQLRREPSKPLVANGSAPKEVAQKSKTMTRQEAHKIQEHISNLRAVKPSANGEGVAAPVERRSGETKTSVNHQKSNSIGGGKSLQTTGSNGHQRQASDSVINGTSLKASSRPSNGTIARERVAVEKKKDERPYPDQLPPPLLTQDMEWSCRFCTFLNDNSRRICEMCAKSRDFNLDKTNSATCV